MRDASYEFLKKLLSTPGPSGREAAVAKLWREEAEKFADVRGDRMGNSFATLGAGGGPRVMLSGHIDEIGLMVTHVDEQGLVRFSGVGGWDPQVLVGQRVRIQTKNGEVMGVIGKKAIHVMEPDERKKVSEIKGLWIDIGAKDTDEAKGMVEVGDVAVLDQDLLELPNGRIASRSLDNRMGAFVVLEALRLLSEQEYVAAEVVAVASVQEEIGLYGARGAAFGLDPDAAIAVDVTHATDTPGIPKNQHGDHALGSGPVIGRASSLSPIVTDGLVAAAGGAEIAYTVEASSRSTGTDADAIHFARAGIATGLVSCPNRYMHSPNEVVDLSDLENAARLIAAYLGGLGGDKDFLRSLEEHKQKTSAWVELSLLLTVFFFGTNFVAVKLVVADVPPFLFAAVRFTFAGLLLFLLLRLTEPESRLKRSDFLPVLGLGVVGITFTQSVFTVGVSLTTAANTALIYSTAPVWGMLLGFFLALERPRLSGVAGVVLCLIGVGAVVYGGLEFEGTSLLGDILILAAAICWGSYTMLSIGLLRRYSPLAVAAYPMVLGGLAAFPLAFLDLRVDVASMSGTVWFAALYSTLCSSAFGFAAWQQGVFRVGANRVLVYQYLVAITGVTAGVILLGENFGPQQILGAIVVLAGVYLARRK